jgi:hypothetical protein
MLSGNIESDITGLSTTGGATTVTKYALTPPGYTSTASVSHTGSGVLASAFSVQVKKGTGSATLLYKPSMGTANPTNAFSGIESFDTLGLGSLRLSDTTLPSNGTASFTWNIEFASLQVFNGATAVTSLFHHVPILSVPLTLSLVHTGNVATLALAAPFNAATMFNSLITLDHGYQIALSEGTTLSTLISSLSSGSFKARPNAPMSFGTIDVVPNIMSPVPEASTYGITAAGLLMGAVALQRARRRQTPVAI